MTRHFKNRLYLSGFLKYFSLLTYHLYFAFISCHESNCIQVIRLYMNSIFIFACKCSQIFSLSNSSIIIGFLYIISPLLLKFGVVNLQIVCLHIPYKLSSKASGPTFKQAKLSHFWSQTYISYPFLWINCFITISITE